MKRLIILSIFFIFGFTLNLISQTEILEDSSKVIDTNNSKSNEEISEPLNASQVSNISPENHANIKVITKANKYYNNGLYLLAIPFYERALKTDGNNKLVLTNLGHSYRLTNNILGQILCFGNLINLGIAEPTEELYYAQALYQNGELEKAKPYFEKYSLDGRGIELASSANMTKEFTKNADAYALSLSAPNSLKNDVCAVNYNDVVVFASNRNKTNWLHFGNFISLYSVKKTGNILDANPRSFLSGLHSKYNLGPVSFSKDYKTIYYTVNYSKKGDKSITGESNLTILVASVANNKIYGVSSLPFVNKDFKFAHPSISNDGNTLYFSSNMVGGKGGMDIYMCKKDSFGIWGSPVNLGDKVNTAGNEIFPFISATGAFYFSSDGHFGMGGLDIFEGTLREEQVTKIYNMGEPVNSKNDDFGIFLNEDNKSGYISSNRKSGGMDDDLYELQILREVKRGKEVLFITKDNLTGQILPNTTVKLNGDSIITDEKGEYLTCIDEDKECKVEAMKEGYFNLIDKIKINNLVEMTIKKDLFLDIDPKLFLKGLISDSKTNKLLDSVQIKISDISNTEVFEDYTTNSEGGFNKNLYGKKINEKLIYLLRFEKRGYLNRTVIFSHQASTSGEIDMNKLVNLSMGKVEVGMEIGKMIDLKPIYFDIGKSTIRKDAALELDKIVEVMKEYPNMFIELGSHTDCRGNSADNKNLSTSRSLSSVKYIVKKGINKLRIVGKGYGESRLLNNCGCEGKLKNNCSEEEHTKNRRTEFLITKLK